MGARAVAITQRMPAIEDSRILVIGGAGFVVVLYLALLTALVSMTGVPYYVIRHRDVDVTKQLRAAALSLYCGAPLSLMGAAVALAVAGMAAGRLTRSDWDLALYCAAGGVFLMLMVVLLFDVQRIIRWMLGGSGTAFQRREAHSHRFCLGDQRRGSVECQVINDVDHQQGGA